MQTVPTIQHPAWCDRQDCARRGAHRARAVTLDSRDGNTVVVQLVQAILHGDPYIIVDGEDGHVVLSIGQARAVGFAVRNACHLAGGAR